MKKLKLGERLIVAGGSQFPEQKHNNKSPDPIIYDFPPYGMPWEEYWKWYAPELLKEHEHQL